MFVSVKNIDDMPDAVVSEGALAQSAKERIVFGFNTFYSDFLSGLAKSSDAMRRRLKKNYRVVDRKSDAYLIEFWRSAKSSGALAAVFDEGASMSTPQVSAMSLAKALHGSDVPESEFPAVRLLCAVAWLFDELVAACEEPEEDAKESGAAAVSDLFQRLISSVSAVHSGQPWGDALDGVLDESARGVMRATLASLAEGGSAVRADAAAADAFDMLNCSKLASLVRDISESVDKEELRGAIESGDLTGPGSMDVMGKLFRQVSSAISEKIKTGEISQQDLVAETSRILGALPAQNL